MATPKKAFDRFNTSTKLPTAPSAGALSQTKLAPTYTLDQTANAPIGTKLPSQEVQTALQKGADQGVGGGTTLPQLQGVSARAPVGYQDRGQAGTREEYTERMGTYQVGESALATGVGPGQLTREEAARRQEEAARKAAADKEFEERMPNVAARGEELYKQNYSDAQVESRMRQEGYSEREIAEVKRRRQVALAGTPQSNVQAGHADPGTSTPSDRMDKSQTGFTGTTTTQPVAGDSRYGTSQQSISNEDGSLTPTANAFGNTISTKPLAPEERQAYADRAVQNRNVGNAYLREQGFTTGEINAAGASTGAGKDYAHAAEAAGHSGRIYRDKNTTYIRYSDGTTMTLDDAARKRPEDFDSAADRAMQEDILNAAGKDSRLAQDQARITETAAAKEAEDNEPDRFENEIRTLVNDLRNIKELDPTDVIAASRQQMRQQSAKAARAALNRMARGGMSAEGISSTLADFDQQARAAEEMMAAQTKLQYDVSNAQQRLGAISAALQQVQVMAARADSKEAQERALAAQRQLVQLQQASQMALMEYQNELQNQFNPAQFFTQLVGGVGAKALGGWLSPGGAFGG